MHNVVQCDEGFAEARRSKKILSQLSKSSSFGGCQIWPTRIAAGCQHELLCVMAMQDLKWHTIDNVDTEGLDVAGMLEETGTMF